MSVWETGARKVMKWTLERQKMSKLFRCLASWLAGMQWTAECGFEAKLQLNVAFFLLFYVVRWHEDTLTFTYMLTRVHMELFRSCSLWGLNVAPYISEQPSCRPVSELNKMKFSIINQTVCAVRNVSTVWKTEGKRRRGSGFLRVKTGSQRNIHSDLMVLPQIGSAHQPTTAGPITEGLKLMTHLSWVVIMSVDVNSLSFLDINTFHFVMYLFNSFYYEAVLSGNVASSANFCPETAKSRVAQDKMFFCKLQIHPRSTFVPNQAHPVHVIWLLATFHIRRLRSGWW